MYLYVWVCAHMRVCTYVCVHVCVSVHPVQVCVGVWYLSIVYGCQYFLPVTRAECYVRIL